MVLLYDSHTTQLKIIINSDNESLLSDIKMLAEKNKPLLVDDDGLTTPLLCNL